MFFVEKRNKKDKNFDVPKLHKALINFRKKIQDYLVRCMIALI